MENKFLIERKELTAVLVNAITVKMLFTYPKSMIENSGNAAWLQAILVSLISIILITIINKLYKCAGKMSIMELSQKAGGRVFKIIVCILLTTVFLFNASITVRGLPETLKTVLLPLTPLEITLGVFLLAAAFGAYMGIYSISRIHSLFMPISAIVFVGFLLFLIPHADINNIYPIFGKGTLNITTTGLQAVSIFSDIIILYVLMPFLKNFKEAEKCGKRAVIISSIASIVLILSYNLLYSYPASEEFMMPLYQMTRLVKIGDFFQRLEAFFEFVWSISTMLYASLYIYVVCYIWKETFDLKYTKQLIPAFTVILAALSYIPSTTIDLLKIGETVTLVSIPTAFLLPIICVGLYKLRTKRKADEK